MLGVGRFYIRAIGNISIDKETAYLLFSKGIIDLTAKLLNKVYYPTHAERMENLILVVGNQLIANDKCRVDVLNDVCTKNVLDYIILKSSVFPGNETLGAYFIWIAQILLHERFFIVDTLRFKLMIWATAIFFKVQSMDLLDTYLWTIHYFLKRKSNKKEKIDCLMLKQLEGPKKLIIADPPLKFLALLLAEQVKDRNYRYIGMILTILITALSAGETGWYFPELVEVLVGRVGDMDREKDKCVVLNFAELLICDESSAGESACSILVENCDKIFSQIEPTIQPGASSYACELISRYLSLEQHERASKELVMRNLQLIPQILKCMDTKLPVWFSNKEDAVSLVNAALSLFNKFLEIGQLIAEQDLSVFEEQESSVFSNSNRENFGANNNSHDATNPVLQKALQTPEIELFKYLCDLEEIPRLMDNARRIAEPFFYSFAN